MTYLDIERDKRETQWSEKNKNKKQKMHRTNSPRKQYIQPVWAPTTCNLSDWHKIY